MIITFLWIVYAIMLFTTFIVTSNRTKILQKTVITLLRKIDLNDNELIENSRANILAENAKRNDMILILNEYGIYFMNLGLTENEIVRFKTKSYNGYENGNTRWVIWINDFIIGERVRVYPGCEHIFHLKCSQLWLEIEGICPVWSNTPQDLSHTDLINPIAMEPNSNVIADILSTNNLNLAPAPLQIPFNLGDNEMPLNQNFDENNLREPLLRQI